MSDPNAISTVWGYVSSLPSKIQKIFSTNNSLHVTDRGIALSDQGAVLACTTTVSAEQAIPTGTTHIRFHIKGIAAGATAWAAVKFGVTGLTVTANTGSTISADGGAIIIPIPSTATHFVAISGANLDLNWTPA